MPVEPVIPHKSNDAKLTLREEFITFANAYDLIRPEDIDKKSNELRLTGVALGDAVEDLAKAFDVDLQFCVGFGTGNCSVMASETKGAVQKLKKRHLMHKDAHVITTFFIIH